MYEAFARNALAALSAGDHEDASVIREQLASATFTEMDYTGAGFFLTMQVNPSSPRLLRSGNIGDVHAEAPDAEAPVGLLLFVEEGLVTTLEAFAYGEWPSDLRQYRMQYIAWRRNSDGESATAVNVPGRHFDSMWG